MSNEANPAYAAGALHGLEAPFVINFGNHRGPEPGPWFGEPVGIVDFGTELAVLNFGRAWDTGSADADQLLEARAGARIKVINAFEWNAPVREFFDRHSDHQPSYAPTGKRRRRPSAGGGRESPKKRAPEITKSRTDNKKT